MASKNKQNEVIVVREKSSPALIIIMTTLITALLIAAIVLGIRVLGGDGSAPVTPANSSEAMVVAVNSVDQQMGTTAHPSGALYIGQQVCTECHKEQAAKMAQIRMSQAINLLVNSPDVPDAIKTPRCLGCHVTGFGMARAAGVTAADMVNVQCEACHGPGSKYVELMKKGYKAIDPAQRKVAVNLGLNPKPDKDTCFNCHHDEPGQTPWNYDEHREFIRHWDGK